MIRWVLIALAGLAVAAVVSLSASDLTSQPVGLSSEPLTAGDQLAPRSAVTRTVTRTVTTRPHRTTTTTTATTTTSPPPVTTTDDDHGRGRGRGGDDKHDGDGDDD